MLKLTEKTFNKTKVMHQIHGIGNKMITQNGAMISFTILNLALRTPQLKRQYLDRL
jgi:hypothetical protein